MLLDSISTVAWQSVPLDLHDSGSASPASTRSPALSPVCVSMFHRVARSSVLLTFNPEKTAGRATSGTTALLRWLFSMLTRYRAAPIQIRKVPVIGTRYYQRRRNVSLQHWALSVALRRGGPSWWRRQGLGWGLDGSSTLSLSP